MTVSVLYDIKPFSQRSLPHVNDSKTCSIQVPNYIKQKLEEKQKIDQEIKHANDILIEIERQDWRDRIRCLLLLLSVFRQ
jgi:hypothetical protein